MTLGAIRRFRIPRESADETNEALQHAGQDGHELFVLWSGRITDTRVFTINTVHVPQQSSYTLPSGLLVRVDGDELHRVNTWLFEHEERLVAQVHAHPRDAYHSETDDTFPIVTTEGGLSIVVPDFAAIGLEDPATAIYRLRNGDWNQEPADILEVLDGDR